MPADDGLDVATVTHWDPYGLKGIVHGDFDGDGRSDIAGWNVLGYWLVGLADTDGTLDTTKWPERWARGWNWRTFLAGDFDADGRDDIAMFAGDGSWWVARSTGEQFETTRWDQPGDWWIGNAWIDWEVGDFNGDGMSDVAGLSRAGSWEVGLSTGSALQAETWLPAWSWVPRRVRSVLVGDFDGDGKSDLAGLFTDWKCRVAISSGSTFTSDVWAGIPYRPIKWRGSTFAGDITGDGKSDIGALDRFGQTWLYRSSGTSFTCAVVGIHPTVFGHPVQLEVGDFNDDEKADVAILTHTGKWLVAASDGTYLRYRHQGDFGEGAWIATFASDFRESDLYVNYHSRFGRRNSRLYFVSPQDLALLGQDPSFFETIFQAYQFRLRELLGTSFWEGNDRAIAFALATIVAYESASYRGFNDPEGWFRPPRSYSVTDLLAARKLVCNEYGSLAAGLYRILFPAESDPDTTLNMVGFGSGPFGNHAQLFFVSGDVALVGDPTLGLVAQSTFESLRSGIRLSGSFIWQLTRRVESTPYMEGAMSSFRSSVHSALVGGGYRRTSVKYIKPM